MLSLVGRSSYSPKQHLSWFSHFCTAQDKSVIGPQPISISIGSAIFAGLSTVTDRQTDHATRTLTVGCIYVCHVINHAAFRGVLCLIAWHML